MGNIDLRQKIRRDLHTSRGIQNLQSGVFLCHLRSSDRSEELLPKTRTVCSLRRLLRGVSERGSEEVMSISTHKGTKEREE
jgi:hypothetical protein